MLPVSSRTATTPNFKAFIDGTVATGKMSNEVGRPLLSVRHRLTMLTRSLITHTSSRSRLARARPSPWTWTKRTLLLSPHSPPFRPHARLSRYSRCSPAVFVASLTTLPYHLAYIPLAPLSRLGRTTKSRAAIVVVLRRSTFERRDARAVLACTDTPTHILPPCPRIVPLCACNRLSHTCLTCSAR